MENLFVAMQQLVTTDGQECLSYFVASTPSVMYHRSLPRSLIHGDPKMKIALASDHAGYAEKERLKPLLNELGLDVQDLGTVSEDSVDYPDYARKVAEEVAQGRVDQGVLVCGSGTGMAITANKVPGVRAAVAWSEETARLARQHNDANVMAIGARTTPAGQIPAIVRAWFSADFEGGRHADRVEKIESRKQYRY
jgi:ribose 5-phosphate isomerase B